MDSPSGSSSASATRTRCFTGTGDRGVSGLLNGNRIGKDDAVFEAIGDLDELNAHLGLVREHVPDRIGSHLAHIQRFLFSVGAHLALPRVSSSPSQLARHIWDDSQVTFLEHWIIDLDHELPVLTNFVIPARGLGTCHLHVARAVCRRLERHTVPLIDRADTDAAVGQYLNRLSSYLFVAARWCQHHAGAREELV